jgi:hypothetical protein
MEDSLKLLYVLFALLTLAVGYLGWTELNPVSVTAATTLNKQVACALAAVTNVKTPSLIYATSLATSSFIEYSIKCTILPTVAGVNPTTFTITLPNSITPITQCIQGTTTLSSVNNSIINASITPNAATNNTVYTVMFGVNDATVHTLYLNITGLLV